MKKLKLISVGALFKNKNHIFLLEIVKCLSKIISTELIILGEGPERSIIEEKIQFLKLNDYVKLVGNVNDVETYLHKSDIYVHSSYSESFGLVFIEAMAAGLPCCES